MGLFSQKPLSVLLTTNEPVGNIAAGNAVKVTCLDDEGKIEIKMPFAKKGTPSVFLSYSQITAVERLSEKEIVSIVKDKNAIGRAIVGGLVFGSLGTIVGAASGAGSKHTTKNQYTFYIVINYVSSETKSITFTIPEASLGASSNFVEHIRNVCNIKPISFTENINL